MEYRFIRSTVMIALVGILPSMAGAKYFNQEYLGIEVIQTNQNFKSRFGDKIFHKNPQNFNVFGGFNFTKHFGLEAGYQFQPNRSKNVELVQGDYVPNPDGTGLITAGEQVLSQSHYKMYMPYLGLFINAATKNFEYKALLGAAFSHANAQYTLDVYNNGVYSPPTITRSYSQSKVVPIVKLMSTGFVTPNFGIRVSLQYINTSQFKMTADQTNAVGSKALVKMTDSYGIGLGVIYTFG